MRSHTVFNTPLSHKPRQVIDTITF